MNTRKIITPVLEYWQFSQNPFEDVTIRDNNRTLFVGRKDDLMLLQNSLSNRLTGIYGSYGVGKSSLLWKLINQKQNKDLPFIYVSAGMSYDVIFREILKALLNGIIKKRIKISSKYKIDAKLEIKRIEAGISLTSKTQVGLKVVATAQTEKSETISSPPYSEGSACEMISNILEHSKTAIIIVIDNLERLKFSGNNPSDYIHFIITVANSIDESFNYQGIAFVISLDERFEDYYNKIRSDSEGALNLSFGRLINIKNFSPQELVHLIKKRLVNVGWHKLVSDFIDIHAFWLLYSTSFGHARRSLRILQAAMEYIASRKLSKKLNVKAIEKGIELIGEKNDEKDFEIIKQLLSKGSRSSSDTDFQIAVNLKRQQLGKRLNSLVDKVCLQISTEPTGKTTKDVYKLPNIKLNI